MTDATLYLKVNSTEVGKGAKSLDQLAQSGGKAEASTTALTKATDILARAAKVAAGALGAYKLLQYAKDATLLAARYETMGIVMKVAGNNAGYTSAQMDKYSKSLQKNGISMLQSRDALTQLATANISLAKASEIGRAAQDLAVVGNVNSSEAMNRMIHGIKSGQIEVLRTLGLNVSFEESYTKLAKELGKNTEALTGQEKALARTNAVLSEAKNYAGIYEESMTTAGKAMSSLTRYSENLQLKLGKLFLPALSDAVFQYTDALKAANAEMDKLGSAGNIDRIGVGLGGAFKTVYETVVVLAANVGYVFTTIGNEIGGIAAQVAAVLHGDFAGAAAIRKEMIKDAEAGRKAIDAFSERMLNHGKVVNAVSKYDEEAAIKHGIASRAKVAADEKSAAASDKVKSALVAQQKSITTMIASLEKEAATFGMTTTQSRVYELATLNASSAQIKAAEAALNKVDALQLEKDRLDAVREAEESRAKTLDSSTEAVIQSTEQMRFETAEIGNTSKEIEVLRLARYDHVTQIEIERLAVLDAANACTIESEALRNNIKARQSQRTAMVDNAGRKAIQEAIDAEKKASIDMWRSIDQTAHDTFVSIMDGGKNTAQRLKETFKNTFFDWLYSMTAKKWIINISGAGGAGASGTAMAGSTASSMASSMASSAAASTVFGSAFAVGSEVGMSASAEYAAAAMSSGSYASALGFAASAAAPVVVGLLVAKYGFGLGNSRENVGAARLEGTVGSTSVNAQMAQDWKVDGGWFGFDSKGTDYAAISEAMRRRIASDAESVRQVFVAYGKAVGDTTVPMKYFVSDVNDLANGIGRQLVPALEEFRLEGETLVDTAERVTAQINAANAYVKSLEDVARAQFRSAVDAKNALRSTAESIREFSAGLSGSTQIGLKATFENLNALAAQGDITAQGKLQGAATGYLAQARTGADSALEYARVVMQVQTALNATASTLDATVSDTELQLTEAQVANGYLRDISIGIQSGNVAVGVTNAALADGIVTFGEANEIDRAIEASVALGTMTAQAGNDIADMVRGLMIDSNTIAGAGNDAINVTNAALADGIVTYNEANEIEKAIKDSVALGVMTAQAGNIINNMVREAAVAGNVTAVDARDITNALAQSTIKGNVTAADARDITDKLTKSTIEGTGGNATVTAIRALEKTMALLTASTQMTANVSALKNTVGAGFAQQNLTLDVAAGTAAYQQNQYTQLVAAGGEVSTVVDTQLKANLDAKAAAYAKLQAALNTPKPVMDDSWNEGGSWGRTERRKGAALAHDRNVKQWQSAIDEARVQYATLPAFAVGTNTVPYDMTARIHQGEEIKPRTYVDMERSAREETNRLLERLQSEVSQLRSEARSHSLAIATNTGKAARILDKFDGDGLPAERVA